MTKFDEVIAAVVQGAGESIGAELVAEIKRPGDLHPTKCVCRVRCEPTGVSVYVVAYIAKDEVVDALQATDALFSGIILGTAAPQMERRFQVSPEDLGKGGN